MSDVTIVIPTMGLRNSYLQELIQELVSAPFQVDLIIIAPIEAHSEILRLINEHGYRFALLEDPKKGLASAINVAFEQIKTPYWSWIGDDDLIEVRNYHILIETLERHSSRSFAFGICRYSTLSGIPLGVNRFGRIALSLIRYGPNLVPQPAVVFRHLHTLQARGLNENLKYAFDQDLIQKLQAIGGGIYIPLLCAEYRWHSDTLTSVNRWSSARESFKVRLHHARNKLDIFLITLLFVPTLLLLRIADHRFKYLSGGVSAK